MATSSINIMIICVTIIILCNFADKEVIQISPFKTQGKRLIFMQF